MTKKIFAIVMSVCLFATAFAFSASAAVAPTVNSEIPIEYRFCPGAVSRMTFSARSRS